MKERVIIPQEVFLNKWVVRQAEEYTLTGGLPIYNWNFESGKVYDLQSERIKRRPFQK
jgi:hypothetical protein